MEEPPPPQNNIKLTVNPAEVHLKLGSAYARKSEINGAVANYNRAIELDSQYAEAYYQRAIVYSAVQDYNSAISDGAQFLKLAPIDPRADQMKQWIEEWQNQVK